MIGRCLDVHTDTQLWYRSRLPSLYICIYTREKRVDALHTLHLITLGDTPFFLSFACTDSSSQTRCANIARARLMLCVYIHIYIYPRPKRRDASGREFLHASCRAVAYFFAIAIGFVVFVVLRFGERLIWQYSVTVIKDTLAIGRDCFRWLPDIVQDIFEVQSPAPLDEPEITSLLRIRLPMYTCLSQKCNCIELKILYTYDKF